MPSPIGKASVWLITIRRFASVCSIAKMAPVGNTLIESPDPLAIRKRSRSSRYGVVRISIDESNITPPTARDLSYIGLPAASGRACEPKPDCSRELDTSRPQPPCGEVRQPKSPCFIRRTKTRGDERGWELRY